MRLSLLFRTRKESPKTIVVFGAGRSGTTWLAQILAAAGMELIFEPLNSAAVPAATAFEPLPPFATAGDNPRWAPVMTRILAGEIRNEWTVRANPGAPRRVVKFIRANLIIDWILHNFQVSPVFIIRNPLGVVASMKEQKWNIAPDFIRHTMQRGDLARAFFGNFVDLLQHDLRQAEAYALFWCLHCFPPMAQGVLRRIPVVIYEDLVRDPEPIVKNLAKRLNFEITGAVREQIARPSFMAGARSAQPGYDPVSSWKTALSPQEVDTISAIVRRFGLGRCLTFGQIGPRRWRRQSGW